MVHVGTALASACFITRTQERRHIMKQILGFDFAISCELRYQSQISKEQRGVETEIAVSYSNTSSDFVTSEQKHGT